MKQDTELHKMELAISHVLRSGTIISGIAIFTGWVWMWIAKGDQLQNFGTYNERRLPDMITDAIHSNDYGMLLSLGGLALLVSLPIIRVLLTALLFIKQKNRILAVMAIAVFMMLVASFILGIEL